MIQSLFVTLDPHLMLREQNYFLLCCCVCFASCASTAFECAFATTFTCCRNLLKQLFTQESSLRSSCIADVVLIQVKKHDSVITF
mmetsp:Transcript_9016/g.12398  ORF Transcript_9016/g.12398 Transcript_9016/m.12398 type:complete len:85 (+) Transcript_9016:16-270(+)